MFNVNIREYFLILNVFIVCIRNTAMFKLIPLLCTHVYSYMFNTVHPPRANPMARIVCGVGIAHNDATYLSAISCAHEPSFPE